MNEMFLNKCAINGKNVELVLSGIDIIWINRTRL